MRGTILCAALLAAFSCGCSGCRDPQKAPPTTTTSASATVPSASPEEQRIESLKKLALADSRGSSALDQKILALRIAAEKNPKKVDIWINLGHAWISKARTTADPGFYLHADAAADIALSLHDGDRLALGLKSMIALSNHEFEKAREVSERILKDDPTDPVALGSLSDAYYEVGEIEKAAKAAQRMADSKPNLASYGRVAYLAWIYGRNAEAKDVMKLAIESGRGAKDTEPYAWQVTESAMIFWHEGDYEGAEIGFDHALSVFHDYPAALAGKGRTAMSRGEPRRAMSVLASSYKANPSIETAWLLADAQDAAGEHDLARTTRESLEKEGKRTDKRTLSLYYSTRNEHPDDALALAEEEMKARPGIYTRDALAWALYRKGKLPEASAAIALATKYGTKDARLLYHAGAIQIALASGDKEKAKPGVALVEQALKLNPHFDMTAAPEAERLIGRTPERDKK